MKIPVSTSIDLSSAEQAELHRYFPDNHIEITKEIYKPGIDSSYLLLNFVISALAGGLLYDAFKEGILRLYRNRFNSQREVVITINSEVNFYRIKGKEIAKMDSTGKFKEVPSIEELLANLDAEILDNKENT